MADRNGYIGRAPSDSSITVARQTNQPTGVTTTFVFNSGYDVGYLDVYINGSKLINALDYQATDTQNVVLTTPAVNGDVIEFVAYKAFNLTNVVTQASGDLVVEGSNTATNGTFSGTVEANTITQNGVGVVTTGGDGSTLIGIVTTLTAGSNISLSGSTGSVTITGLANTSNVLADTLVVTGLTTTTNEIEIKSSDGTPARVDYYCEVNNAHYARVQAPPHSEFSGNVTAILPTKSGDIIVGDTNGAITQHINTTGIVTATSFVGSGASLTGIDATSIKDENGAIRIQANTSGAVVTGILTTNTLSNAELVNYSENVNSLGNTGSAATIDVVDGNFVVATLNSNCTFTFSSVTSGKFYSFGLQLTNSGGPHSITWPTSVKWPGGSLPTRTTTSGRTDVYGFYTTDGGTNWYGSISQYNYN